MDAEMPDDKTPIPAALPVPQSGSEPLEGEESDTRSLLRTIFGVLLGVLMMADVGMYSLHKAMESRVEAQDRRIERMDGMLTDILASRDNSEKIEEIEQQVDGIESQIGELADLVRDNQKAKTEAAEPKPTK